MKRKKIAEFKAWYGHDQDILDARGLVHPLYLAFYLFGSRAEAREQWSSSKIRRVTVQIIEESK